jgi:hypothetical protein
LHAFERGEQSLEAVREKFLPELGVAARARQIGIRDQQHDSAPLAGSGQV